MKQWIGLNKQIYEFILILIFILSLSFDIIESECTANDGIISTKLNLSFSKCCKGFNNQSLKISGENVSILSIDFNNNSLCYKSFDVLTLSDTNITHFNFPNITGLSQIKFLNLFNNLLLERIEGLSEVFPEIEKLIIRNSSMRILTKHSLSNLSKLKALYISNNRKLATIANGAFNGLVNLKILSIGNNFITNIDPSVFKDPGKSLQELLLVFNPVHSQIYNKTLFGYLENLKILRINLGFVSVPDSGPYLKAGVKTLENQNLKGLTKLETLDLSYLKIENLRENSFYGLRHLKVLELRVNRIQIIPNGALKFLNNLEALYLSKNQIKCISAKSLSALVKLRILDLSYNKIDYISTLAMNKLTVLKELNLNYNKLFVIEPNAFGNLNSLEKLKINLVEGRANQELLEIMGRMRNRTQIYGLENYGIKQGNNGDLINQTIGVSDKETCPTAKPKDKFLNSYRSYGRSRSDGSRKYLLVIIGVCVLFLLLAVSIIMTYRAWSKRRSERSVMYNNDQELKIEQGQAHPNNTNLKSENIPLTSDVPSSTTVVNNNGKRPISINNIDDEGTYLTPLGVL